VLVLLTYVQHLQIVHNRKKRLDESEYGWIDELRSVVGKCSFPVENGRCNAKKVVEIGILEEMVFTMCI
jgi:hypothetical protein